MSHEQPSRGRLARLFEAADRHRVPLRTTTTLATRLGAGPEWVLAALGVAAAGTGAVLGARARRRAGGPGPTPTDPTSPGAG